MAGGQQLKRLIFQGSSAYTLLADSPTEANLQLLSLPGLGQPALAGKAKSLQSQPDFGDDRIALRATGELLWARPPRRTPSRYSVASAHHDVQRWIGSLATGSALALSFKPKMPFIAETLPRLAERIKCTSGLFNCATAV
ncbi:hypothetical protein GX50_08473 [[Emmonsia] crescens]|uniref:Uncharacterized protein n=1 Tax=[Emmonsia] crescens TaxID=73230 RepID=A0A2B7Z5B5_9EURO|nr:hypothetical protein GX50_08473 [Emmonsia crescens]